MRQLNVAVAQIHSRAGDVAGNLARIERQVHSAAAVGAEVILFAEAAVHGFDLSRETLERAEPVDGPIGHTLSGLAIGNGMTILAGFFERDGSRIFNSVLVARPDGRRECQRKHRLTAEERSAKLTAGERTRTIFDFSGVRCIILICADTGIPDLDAELTRQGIEFRFLATAGGGRVSDMLHEADLRTQEGRTAFIKDRIKVYQPGAVYETVHGSSPGFASANALGYDGREMYHRGHCLIVDPQGIVRAQIAGTNVLEHQEDQMVRATLCFA